MRDPRDLDGRDKRKTPGTQNTNVDRLEWLISHGKITQTQLDAGRKLQADSELAQIGGFSTMGSGLRSVNLAPSNLPDAKLDAISRVNGARMAVVATAWRLLELVVIENINLHVAGQRLWGHSGRGECLGALRFALDVLSQHYGMA